MPQLPRVQQVAKFAGKNPRSSLNYYPPPKFICIKRARVRDREREEEGVEASRGSECSR